MNIINKLFDVVSKKTFGKKWDKLNHGQKIFINNTWQSVINDFEEDKDASLETAIINLFYNKHLLKFKIQKPPENLK